MMIKVDDIECIFKKIVEKLRLDGIKRLTVNNKDYYWLIGSPEWTNLSSVAEPEVGSFVDDWESLKKVTEGSHVATYVDFDRLSSILRLISDELNPVACRE